MPAGPDALLHVGSVSSLYTRAIVDTGRQPELLFYVAFLLSFGFIRSSAHMIRAQVSWWPGNVEVGGTHIHHLVWGILLVLASGYVAVAFQPASPGAEIVAVVFGIGTGLTLDEFALWLTLRDVYWEREGRRSIDAVIVVAAFTGLMLVGFRAWIDLATGIEALVFSVVGSAVLVTAVCVAVNLLKEKLATALIGVLIAPVAWVGAVRFARPGSPWGRRYGPEKRERAELRFPADGPRGPRGVLRAWGLKAAPQPEAGSGASPADPEA